MSAPGRVQRTAELVRRANRRADVVRALRAARERLPGDENFGDHLSRIGDRPEAIIARFLTEPETWLPGITREPGEEAPQTASRELALTGLQVWQALSQRIGRGAGSDEVAIMFSDIVGFSSWVLEVGDEDGLELLRAIAGEVEPTVAAHHGRVVKRLGDGHMAVFFSAEAAVEAALEIRERVGELEIAGHQPRLRIGVHRGTPRRLGGDYLGTDVNIAARVCEAARPSEILVTAGVLDTLDAEVREALELRRRRRFRAKGAPSDLPVFAVQRGTADRG